MCQNSVHVSLCVLQFIQLQASQTQVVQTFPSPLRHISEYTNQNVDTISVILYIV